MIKLIGCCTIMFAIAGLINEWYKRCLNQLQLLRALKDLYENGAFYLARQQQRTPAFFEGISGNKKEFNIICHEIGVLLKSKKYKSGDVCWRQVWEKKLRQSTFDENTRELILLSGSAFFEKNSQSMELKLLENSREIEKEIARHSEMYREKFRVICPVGILAGVMLLIILL